ncbi:hypothetical protein [Streptomyces sp. KN37]|nr:hypothetical protein [Streptomyces sp. KN37]WPO75419.1 hypothetical protein R9806_34905 [Streptomyces sp. KN37]
MRGAQVDLLACGGREVERVQDADRLPEGNAVKENAAASYAAVNCADASA